jgi:type II secretory pathway component PulM
MRAFLAIALVLGLASTAGAQGRLEGVQRELDELNAMMAENKAKLEAIVAARAPAPFEAVTASVRLGDCVITREWTTCLVTTEFP